MQAKIQDLIEKIIYLEANQVQKIEELEKEIYQIFKIEEQIQKALDYFNDKKIESRIKKIVEKGNSRLRKHPLKSISQLLRNYENKTKNPLYGLLSLAYYLKKIKTKKNNSFNAIKNKLISLFKNPIYEKILNSIEEPNQKDKILINQEVLNKPKKSFMIRDILGLEENKTSTNVQQLIKDKSNQQGNFMTSNQESSKINLEMPKSFSFDKSGAKNSFCNEIKETDKSQNNLDKNPFFASNEKEKTNQLESNKKNSSSLSRKVKVTNWLNCGKIHENITQQSLKCKDKEGKQKISKKIKIY